MNVETERFTLTKEEYVTLYSAAYENAYSRGQAFGIVVAVISSIVGWFLVQSNDKLAVIVSGAAFATAVLFSAYAIYYSSPKARLRKSVDLLIESDQLDPTSYQVSESGLRSAAASGSNRWVPIESIRRVNSKVALVLLIGGGTGLVYLPRRVFRSDQDYDAFMNWALTLPSKEYLS